jgi:hypothetical protein
MGWNDRDGDRGPDTDQARGPCSVASGPLEEEPSSVEGGGRLRGRGPGTGYRGPTGGSGRTGHCHLGQFRVVFEECCVWG